MINHRGFLKNNSKYIDRSSHFFASFLYGDIPNDLHSEVQKELFDVSMNETSLYFAYSTILIISNKRVTKMTIGF